MLTGIPKNSYVLRDHISTCNPNPESVGCFTVCSTNFGSDTDSKYVGVICDLYLFTVSNELLPEQSFTFSQCKSNLSHIDMNIDFPMNESFFPLHLKFPVKPVNSGMTRGSFSTIHNTSTFYVIFTIREINNYYSIIDSHRILVCQGALVP